MKGTELRIGNLIQWNKAILNVVMIGNETFSGIDNKGHRLNLLYDGDGIVEGIALTEQWLIDFGFAQKDMADMGIYTYLEIHHEISLSFNSGEDETIWIGQYDTNITTNFKTYTTPSQVKN